MGIAKISPVAIFEAPAQKSIAGKDKPATADKPRIIGKKVPKSPREPESSCLSNRANERFSRILLKLNNFKGELS